MSKITKQIAHDIATKVVSRLVDSIDETKEKLEQEVTTMYIATIPENIMKLYNDPKTKSYINTNSSCKLDGNGFNRYTIYFEEDLPSAQSNEWYNILNITAAQAKVLQKLVDKIDNLQDKRERTFSEVKNSLLALGTYKKVQEQLPELAEFLPGQTKQLMIVPQQVRETVKCLLSDDSKCIDKV